MAKTHKQVCTTFRFARALVSNDTNVSDFAHTSLGEELVDLFFLSLQVDARHQHRAIVSLRLLSLALRLF